MTTNSSRDLQHASMLQHADHVYDIGNEALKRVLSKVGTRGLTFEETSIETESFEYISKVMDTLDGDIPIPEKIHSMPRLSSFLAGDSIPEHISQGTEFKTKVSWTQTSCGCRNKNCTDTAALDPIGFFNVANGLLRGRSQIVFIGDDGKVLPCLKHTPLPKIEELTLTGPCKWTDYSLDVCLGKTNTTSFFRRNPIIHSHRCVECSSDAGIDDLRIEHNGKLVARALKSSEILSSEIDDLDAGANTKLGDMFDQMVQLQAVKKMDLGTIDVVGFKIPATINLDLADISKDIVLDVGNAVFQSFSPQDFDSKEKPASQASIAEVTRAMDTVYHTQLSKILHLGYDDILPKIESLPLYVAKQIERPEASSLQEIVSSMTFVLIASCGFGALLGSSLRQKQKCIHSPGSIVAILGAFLVLLLETYAFYLGWVAEIEHNEFSKTIVHMELKGSKRFSLNPFGTFDLKGAPFVVDTYVVELSDAGDKYGWVYALGAIACFTALIATSIYGVKLQVTNDDDDDDCSNKENKNVTFENESMGKDEESYFFSLRDINVVDEGLESNCSISGDEGSSAK